MPLPSFDEFKAHLWHLVARTPAPKPSGVPQILYKHKFALPLENTIDMDVVTELYRTHWGVMLWIGIAYITTIKVIERLMETREPFKLKWSLFAWNAILAIFSMIATARCAEELYYVWTTHGFYASICHAYHPYSTGAFWFFLFSTSKLWELGDTVFLVLRKRPLSFLHCYHHMTVLLYAFHGGAEQMAAGRCFIVLNFTAHSAMYSYFAVMAIGYRVPKFIAVCVTSFQIFQMISALAISGTIAYLKITSDYACQATWANLILASIIYGSYGYLFCIYFVDAYIKPKSKKTLKTD